jgi:hypothetical protein
MTTKMMIVTDEQRASSCHPARLGLSLVKKSWVASDRVE